MISAGMMKFVDKAVDCAINNNENVNSKHGAVLVKSGKIVCSACNTETLHAEVNCIKQAQIKGSQT